MLHSWPAPCMLHVNVRRPTLYKDPQGRSTPLHQHTHTSTLTPRSRRRRRHSRHVVSEDPAHDQRLSGGDGPSLHRPACGPHGSLLQGGLVRVPTTGGACLLRAVWKGRRCGYNLFPLPAWRGLIHNERSTCPWAQCFTTGLLNDGHLLLLSQTFLLLMKIVNNSQ